jgi:hypothetical protein
MYYLGFFGGLQPLCGIAVTSFISVISNPATANERIAVSFPWPVPLTLTTTLFNPIAMAFLAAAVAANPAA